MRNKLILNAVKCLFYFTCIILIVFQSIYFSGCSGSDEDEVLTQRHKDSISIYLNLQKSFTGYQKALSENETGAEAAPEFEASLKSLNEIPYSLITKGENYFWKKDYDELLTSIVQDYFATQSEINSSSLIFELSKRVPVEYEKIEHLSPDREPLPEGSDVPLIRNSVVDSYIEFFSNTDRGRSFIDKSLYRSGKFFPLMRKILKYNNAPEELIYLSVQESGLNPTIVSRAGAVGLWQFMPATGYSYGLEQDGYRDDRRDFEKATDAAARHLKDLYKTYDDWYLAFAAYNAGPGRVNKAIKKSGSRDFWTLRSFLPGETKNYVPSIIGLSFVLRNPEEYGFKDVEYGGQITFDRVELQTEMSLQKVAELCESDIETIRELNSELTNDIVPVYDVPYELRIPHNSFKKFSENFKNASDIDKSNNYEPQFAGNETGTYGSNIAGIEYKVKNYEPEDARLIASKSGKYEVNHKVKPKESLTSLSAYYDVRPTDIRIWNSLNYGINPEKNQKLSIYLSESKYKLLFGIKDDSKLNKIEISETEKQINETPVIISSEKNTNTEPELSDNENSEKDSEITKEVSDETVSENSNEQTETETEVNNNYESNNTEVAEDNDNIQETSYNNESNTTETDSETKDKSYTYYKVQEGDYLSAIAGKYDVSVSEIMEWNSLKSDKILSGQNLKIYGGSSPNSVHTVLEGENLTMIAGKYGVSVAEISELNGLNNDIIYPGQKLKINGTRTPEKNTVKTSGVKKNHKVKKGETLASIASANDISVIDIKKWNNLKSDKLLAGQILKLYDDSSANTGKKTRKKKN